MRILNLLLASSVVILSGCSTVQSWYDAYTMAGYDTNEYYLINKITSVSELGTNQCSEPEKTATNIYTLHLSAVEFKNYTKHIPKNPEATKIASDVLVLVNQLKDAAIKGDMSEGFCKLKMTQINRVSNQVQPIIGRKPR